MGSALAKISALRGKNMLILDCLAAMPKNKDAGRKSSTVCRAVKPERSPIMLSRGALSEYRGRALLDVAALNMRWKLFYGFNRRSLGDTQPRQLRPGWCPLISTVQVRQRIWSRRFFRRKASPPSASQGDVDMWRRARSICWARSLERLTHARSTPGRGANCRISNLASVRGSIRPDQLSTSRRPLRQALSRASRPALVRANQTPQ